MYADAETDDQDEGALEMTREEPKALSSIQYQSINQKLTREA